LRFSGDFSILEPMLAIKFKRTGKKHQASFRVVVGERRSKVLGKFIDDLGWYSPRTDAHEIDKKKAEHWLSVGAQPTDSVHNLLVKCGIVRAKKVPMHLKKKTETTAAGGVPPEAGKGGEAPAAPTPAPAAAAAPETPAAEAPVAEAPVAAEPPAAEEAPKTE
jgi:small subunit ribosomal protein S16